MNKWENLDHEDKIREVEVARVVHIIQLVLMCLAIVTFVLLSAGDSRITIAVLGLLVPSLALEIERTSWIGEWLRAVRNNSL